MQIETTCAAKIYLSRRRLTRHQVADVRDGHRPRGDWTRQAKLPGLFYVEQPGTRAAA